MEVCKLISNFIVIQYIFTLFIPGGLNFDLSKNDLVEPIVELAAACRTPLTLSIRCLVVI